MRYIKKGSIGEKITRNIYYIPVLPLVLGTGVVFASDFSLTFIAICGSVIVIQIIHLIYGYINEKHLDKRWHALTYNVTYNIVAFFCWLPLWIITGMEIWLFLILLLIHLAVLFISFRIHKKVAKGLYSIEKNRFGRYFYLLSFAWIGLSGGGSYGYSRMLQEVYGYSDALVIIATLLLPFTYIFVFLAQGLFVRIIDPTYDYDKY